jgi:hypothetical protein
VIPPQRNNVHTWPTAQQRHNLPLLPGAHMNVFSRGSEVLSAVIMKTSVFWDIRPCSPLKNNKRFGGICHLHFQSLIISEARNQLESKWQAKLCLPPAFTLVSCSAHSSTLKVEEICSSATSVAFQRTTRPYIPKDRTLQHILRVCSTANTATISMEWPWGYNYPLS